MKNTTLKILILMGLVLALTACGDSGKKKVNRVNNTGFVSNQFGNVSTGFGSSGSVDPSLVTVGALITPTSIGVSSFPQGDLALTFERETNGQIYADGALSLPSGYTGISFNNFNCSLPAGTYNITTQTPGRQLSKDHHYGGMVVSATGPVSFTATMPNALASEIQNQWFLHALMDLQTVSGQNCAGFGFPLRLSFGIVAN